MVIKEKESECVQELEQVAKFRTQVFPDDSRFWRVIRHPHDELLVRVCFDGQAARFELFNHKQEEVVSCKTAGVSDDPQALFEKELKEYLRDWRNIVL